MTRSLDCLHPRRCTGSLNRKGRMRSTQVDVSGQNDLFVRLCKIQASLELKLMTHKNFPADHVHTLGQHENQHRAEEGTAIAALLLPSA